MRIVIALGGNAMTSPDGHARPEDQRGAITEAMEAVAELVIAGHQVLLTHGNGPQVGNLLLKNELTADVVPPVPLDWCGAQTQATIGMLVLNALDNALAVRGSQTPSAALVSRTLVSKDDPGFAAPTKPIGRYLGGEEAHKLMEHGQQFVEIEGRGWRRVVASPEPVSCIDGPAADSLLHAGYIVVCSGGGGIPTVRGDNGAFVGVEAVIDKDLTAAIIAEQIDADVLVIATDVESAVADWGTPQARPIGEVSTSEMRRIAVEQKFAAGSMGPKVEAVTRFAERAHATGVITSLPTIGAALAGTAGTRVIPDKTDPVTAEVIEGDLAGTESP